MLAYVPKNHTSPISIYSPAFAGWAVRARTSGDNDWLSLAFGILAAGRVVEAVSLSASPLRLQFGGSVLAIMLLHVDARKAGLG